MDLALLVLRVVVGLLFAGHGSQKLFGVFGGAGLRGTADTFDGLGLRPGRVHAPAAAVAEVAAGVLFALGLLTPVAAALAVAVMVAAVATVHLPKGLWNYEGGYEYNLVMVAVAFALAGVGPGDWSLDDVLGIDWASTGWALVALAAGVLAGIATVVAGRAAGVNRPGTPAERR